MFHFNDLVISAVILFGVHYGVDGLVQGKNCDHLGTLVYEDLDCQPVNKQNDDCPIAYKCPEFSLQTDSCLFRSKTYKVGKSVDSKLLSPSCYGECRCTNNSWSLTGIADFNCAVLDCSESNGKDCYKKYDLNECCSSDQICPPFDSVVTCEWAGETYKEGQKFYPKDTCLSCVCSKGFNGTLSEEFCRKQSCAVQIRHSGDLAANCAPAYFKFGHGEDNVLCCPWHWVCPSTSDNISIMNSGAEKHPDLTCMFGNEKLQLGEGVKRQVNKYGKVRNIDCECVLPPFLTCKEV